MMEAIIGLLGVIVGSGLTIAKDIFAAWRRSKQEGSYSAIRLICILHEYADHCIDVVQDDGTIHGIPAGLTTGGEDYYVAQVRQPAPPQYPDDIAWRSLPEALMHQVLGLPNKARTTDRYIDGQAEYVASPPDHSEYFNARQEGYAKLGYDALNLAEQLANKYEIKTTHKADLGVDWDAKAFLGDNIRRFENLRKEREAKHVSCVGDPFAVPSNSESQSHAK
jgi:hypothetical protein